MDQKELDLHITKRLLEFYDGLMERGQIGPPVQRPAPEDPLPSHYTADSAPSQDRPRSGGEPSHFSPDR